MMKTAGGKNRSLLTASNLQPQSSGDDNSELNADSASTISNASTNMSYQDIDSSIIFINESLLYPKYSLLN